MFEELSMQRPTMRGGDLLHGEILAARPVQLDQPERLEPSELTQASLEGDSNADSGIQDALDDVQDTLDFDPSGIPRLHDLVHRSVGTAFRENARNDVTKMNKLENAHYEALAESMAKELETELQYYSSSEVNVWVPYKQNGKEYWYPMTPKEWMQYIEELLKYKDYFEKEHPGFFKDLLNDLQAIKRSLHPSPSDAPLAVDRTPAPEPIELTDPPSKPLFKPVHVISIVKLTSAPSELVQKVFDRLPSRVHTVAPTPNDEYHDLAESIVTSTVEEVAAELRKDMEAKKAELEKKLSVEAEKALAKHLQEIVASEAAEGTTLAPIAKHATFVTSLVPSTFSHTTTAAAGAAEHATLPPVTAAAGAAEHAVKSESVSSIHKEATAAVRTALDQALHAAEAKVAQRVAECSSLAC